MTTDTSPETIDYRQSGVSTKSYSLLSIVQANTIIEDYSHLIDDKYKKWFYKQLYRVGEREFRKAASIAKEGKTPDRLFVCILKDTKNAM